MRHYRPHCNVCRNVIRGRVYRWSNRTMCKKCYRFFCKNVQKTSTAVRRLRRSQAHQRATRAARRTWLQRLFG